MTIVRNSVAAPIAEPATRKLHGLSSRNATAAAIQFRPQAKASSTTSSLAVVAASLVFLESGMLLETRASGGGKRQFVPARYSEERLAWRVLQRCKFVAEPCAGGRAPPQSTCAYCTPGLAVLATRRFQGVPARFPRRPWRSEFPLEFQ